MSADCIDIDIEDLLKEDVHRLQRQQQQKYPHYHHPKSWHLLKDKEVEILRLRLLNWYDMQHRDLPWRYAVPPKDEKEIQRRAYRTWVSEVMLQQTQVVTVIKYFNRWMELWPTITALATADLSAVNEVWAGLGYYSRAKRLHEAALIVVKQYDGYIPRTTAALLKLPGIGPYTAGAIASIAFGVRMPVVDGNVIRVLTRIRSIHGDPSSKAAIDLFWKLSGEIVDPQRPGDFNQAIMELGATVCTYKAPECGICPIRSHCRARVESALHKISMATSLKGVRENATSVSYSNATTEAIEDVECTLCYNDSNEWERSSTYDVTDYPRKVVKKAPRQESSTVCVLSRQCDTGEEFLLTQRPEKGLLAGMFEFPSVSVPPDSTVESQLQCMREYLTKTIGISEEEISVALNKHQRLGNVFHQFSHISQTYFSFAAKINENIIIKSDITTLWVSRSKLATSAIPTGLLKVFKLFEKGTGTTKSRSKAGKVPVVGKSKGGKKKNQRTISSFFCSSTISNN